MRQVTEDAPVHQLRESNVGENDFWEALRVKCLQPDLKALGWREKSNVRRRGWGIRGNEREREVRERERLLEALRVKCVQPVLRAFGLEGEVKREEKGGGV